LWQKTVAINGFVKGYAGSFVEDCAFPSLALDDHGRVEAIRRQSHGCREKTVSNGDGKIALRILLM
jgi:hypothetical protein